LFWEDREGELFIAFEAEGEKHRWNPLWLFEELIPAVGEQELE